MTADARFLCGGWAFCMFFWWLMAYISANTWNVYFCMHAIFYRADKTLPFRLADGLGSIRTAARTRTYLLCMYGKASYQIVPLQVTFHAPCRHMMLFIRWDAETERRCVDTSCVNSHYTGIVIVIIAPVMRYLIQWLTCITGDAVSPRLHHRCHDNISRVINIRSTEELAYRSVPFISSSV